MDFLIEHDSIRRLVVLGLNHLGRLRRGRTSACRASQRASRKCEGGRASGPNEA